MIKLFYLIILLFLITNCSFNQNSEFWSDEKKNLSTNNDNNKKIVINNDLSFEKLKEEIIEYGKSKEFPDIN